MFFKQQFGYSLKWIYKGSYSRTIPFFVLECVIIYGLLFEWGIFPEYTGISLFVLLGVFVLQWYVFVMNDEINKLSNEENLDVAFFLVLFLVILCIIFLLIAYFFSSYYETASLLILRGSFLIMSFFSIAMLRIHYYQYKFKFLIKENSDFVHSINYYEKGGR